MNRLWCQFGNTLIGRKPIIDKIRKNFDEGKPFALYGERESGKTALLEAAYDLCQGKKSFISGVRSYSESIKKICTDWGIDFGDEKPKKEDYENAVLSCSGNWLFIDDIHQIGGGVKAQMIKAIADRHRVCGTYTSGFNREALKPLLARTGTGLKVPRLSHSDTLKLSEKVLIHFASRLLFQDVATASCGLPGKIVAFATTGVIHDIKSRDEEIDIAPILGICLVCLILFRIIGRALDATDMTLIGGFAMILMIVGRGVFQQGKNK